MNDYIWWFPQNNYLFRRDSSPQKNREVPRVSTLDRQRVKRREAEADASRQSILSHSVQQLVSRSCSQLLLVLVFQKYFIHQWEFQDPYNMVGTSNLGSWNGHWIQEFSKICQLGKPKKNGLCQRTYSYPQRSGTISIRDCFVSTISLFFLRKCQKMPMLRDIWDTVDGCEIRKTTLDGSKPTNI